MQPSACMSRSVHTSIAMLCGADISITFCRNSSQSQVVINITSLWSCNTVMLQSACSKCKVPFRVLRYYTLKASMTSVNAEADVHIADWLMSIFVNELAPPHVCSEQGQCVRQCRRIMRDTFVWQRIVMLVWRDVYRNYVCVFDLGWECHCLPKY